MKTKREEPTVFHNLGGRQGDDTGWVYLPK
jgi:hypothetical protein